MNAHRRSGSSRSIVLAALVSMGVVAGCGSDEKVSSTTPTSTTVADAAGPTTTAVAPDADADAAAPSPAGTETELAAWQGLHLTDSSGQDFSVGELVGRPVLVENFATWCSTCRSQLTDTQEAAAAVGDKAVFLALSIEVDLDPSDLVEYADKNGFDNIRFAVMTPEFLAAMADEFGKSSINAPSTPKIVVDASGSAGKLVTGPESPDEIEAKITAAA